jgi:tRNA-specific 2-thiouridylase
VGDRATLTAADVVDTGGAVVGRVDAVELVTVGQRRGLGLAGGHAPRYVLDVDVEHAVVTVGDEVDLLAGTTAVGSWTGDVSPGQYAVQCSAHGAAVAAEVDGCTIRWLEPRRRVAPGQLVVAYEGDEVVGSAVATA